MSEILSQAEIDALLNLVGGSNAPDSAWQAGEQEAVTRVGELIAEVASVTWQNRLGSEYKVSPPGVEQMSPADAAASLNPPGLWVVARLSGNVGGDMAFWAGGPLGAAMAEKILGAVPGETPLSDDEFTNLAMGLTAFFDPLGAALGELVQGPVEVEQAGGQWAAGPDPAGVLRGLLGEATPAVRMEFPCRFGDASGALVCFWPLPDARNFLARVSEAAEAGGAAPGGRPEPSKQVGSARADSGAQRGREDVRAAEFQPLHTGAGRQAPHNIDLILDVPLVLAVELGRTEKQVREILALGPGSVIELDRLAGEPVDVLVNGKLIAKGEVVVVDENFGIRITDIVSRAERLSKLR